MNVKQVLILVGLLLVLFTGAVFLADAAAANLTQALAPGELVEPAVRDPARWGAALCNDGTPFAFVVQPSPSHSALWVIYLEGGQLCDDNAQPCAERDTNLTTTLRGSDGGPAPLIPHDLFSRDPATNPTFHSANIAYAHYCSSDLWSGNGTSPRPTTASASGWYFAGRTNLRAMIEILQDRYGLDDSNPATQVLFTGSSAGGIGVVVNADTVASLLPNTAAAQRLRLVNDAGYIPEFVDTSYNLGDAPASLPDVLSAAYTFWDSALNPACEQAQIAAGDSPSRCFFGAPSYPYLTGTTPGSLNLPYLVAEASIDSDFFSVMNIHWRTRADQAVVSEWRMDALNAFNGVSWVFSDGEMAYHMMLTQDNWTTGPVGGPNLRDLITSFWNGGTPQQDIWGEP